MGVRRGALGRIGHPEVAPGNWTIEQDHRRVKFRVSAMLGFKSFENARIVLAGIELMQKLKKGQYAVPFRFGKFSREIWRSVLAA